MEGQWEGCVCRACGWHWPVVLESWRGCPVEDSGSRAGPWGEQEPCKRLSCYQEAACGRARAERNILAPPFPSPVRLSLVPSRKLANTGAWDSQPLSLSAPCVSEQSRETVIHGSKWNKHTTSTALRRFIPKDNSPLWTSFSYRLRYWYLLSDHSFLSVVKLHASPSTHKESPSIIPWYWRNWDLR